MSMASFWAQLRGARKSQGRKSQGGDGAEKENLENLKPDNSKAIAENAQSSNLAAERGLGKQQPQANVIADKQAAEKVPAKAEKPVQKLGGALREPEKTVEEEPGFHTATVQYKSIRTNFKVRTHLSYSKAIGSGAYGIVAKLEDTATGKAMAVKKVSRAFDDLADGKRILREVRLLRFFNHDNIVRLLDMYTPGGPDFEDIYMATEIMEMDLTRVIRSSEPLLEDHHRWMTYQILLGVLYIHSAGVVHRDLKPSNILVNRDCSVKICDFGLSRGSVKGTGIAGEERGTTSKMTEYVVTRYYRAPEVVLLASEYGPAIDVWSVGCILCEMIGRKPVFKGKDHLDQIDQIIDVMGSPTEEDMAWLKQSPSACRFVARFAGRPGKPWSRLYPEASGNAIGAITSMLRFDPGRRLLTAECLRLPYYSEVWRQEDEVVACETIDWSFDHFTPTRKLLQERIAAEVAALQN